MRESSEPMRPAQSTPARNEGIDLLRGLSILLVVLHHTGLRIPLSKTALGMLLPHRLLSALNYNGYEAVFVFFVISGFLITDGSLRRWESLSRISLKGFYVRRMARILPCLLLLVLVLSLLDAVGLKYFTITHADQSLWRAVMAALGLHLNWYEGHTGYLPGNWDVLWSLSIEEAFYLGFPIACLLLAPRRILVPVLALLAVSLPLSHAALAGNEVWQEKAYLPGMSAIAVGILGALTAAHFKPPRRAFSVALLAAGLAGLVSVFVIEDTLWSTWRDATLLLLTVSACCAVMACHWGAADLRRPLPVPLACVASWGRLSYEIYLTHMFMVFAVVAAFTALGSDMRDGWFWYLPALFGSWLLGAVTARAISQPADHAIRERLLVRR